MKADYVSLEVAKLLKEKGYDDYCEGYYRIGCDEATEDECFELTSSYNFKNSLNKYRIAAPTLYVAQKWLRETKEIHIMIDVCASGYYAVLWKTNGTFIKTLADKGTNDGGVWDTYEDALHVGILESLIFI